MAKICEPLTGKFSANVEALYLGSCALRSEVNFLDMSEPTAFAIGCLSHFPKSCIFPNGAYSRKLPKFLYFPPKIKMLRFVAKPARLAPRASVGYEGAKF